MVATLQPHKTEKHRISLSVGNNPIDYPTFVITATTEMQIVNLHINSVISDDKGSYPVSNIELFYLGTPMTRFEYMRIPVKYLPNNIMKQYNFVTFVFNGHVMVEIRKGMYGLPQTSILAQ